MAAESEQAEDDEEGTISLSLSDFPEEQAHALVFAARASGLRVRAPFQKAGFKKPFARPKFKARPATPPNMGDAEEMIAVPLAAFPSRRPGSQKQQYQATAQARLSAGFGQPSSFSAPPTTAATTTTADTAHVQ